MPLFAVTLKFTTDNDKRVATRPVHREYLKTLLDSGKLAESGPFTDDTGAIMVYDVPTLADAEAQLAADPYSQTGGIIESYTINEWNVVMTRYS